ncbi:MAG: hypothetical protein HYZ90_01850 [Candidatus Omnitrophica bacterium]|nr:hypothetical protein [Candidatus Omnitrophota bacterium]
MLNREMVKRWLVIMAGLFVTVLGFILMLMPGPGGTPLTIAGIAILSAELPWARRFLQRFIAFLRRSRPLWARLLLLGGLVVFWIAGSVIGWRLLGGK